MYEVTEQLSNRLAAQRRIQAQDRADSDRSRPRKVERYDKATVRIFENILLDPERDTLDAWLPTPYDQMISVFEDNSRPPGKRMNGGDGFGVSVASPGVKSYRVRSLHRPTLGAVTELDPLRYWLTKRASMHAESPRYEPVAANEPLREPIMPPNFPSHPQKARAIAAKALKKEADELTFPEILEYFRKALQRGPSVFKL